MRGGFNPDDELIPIHNMLWKVDNPMKFTIIYSLFVSSGLSAPYFVIRHQSLKK
ncbi:Cytochrome c oxidase subunit 7C [Mactra antiquata]